MPDTDEALVRINEAREGRLDWTEVSDDDLFALEAEATRLGLDFDASNYNPIALADAVVAAR